MMPEGMSPEEKGEWIDAQIRLHGLPRRGRPKKGEERLKWSDLGVTRQEMYLWRKLGQVPKADAEAFLAERSKRIAEGRCLSRRAMLIHFGKINVISDDVFDDGPIGNLADQMLTILDGYEPTPKQLRYLGRSLNYKLRNMARLKELKATP